MINDKKHSDSVFDNFLKEKVDHVKLAASDDFDRFCSKLESTGFFEEKKSRRYFWLFFPMIVLLIGGTTTYLYTQKSGPHTILADTVRQSYREKEPKQKDKPEKKKVEIRKENFPENKSVDSCRVDSCRVDSVALIPETPIETDSIFSKTRKTVQKKDSVILAPFLVRKEYIIEVDTIVEVDSQRVSKRKWNKKKK